METQIHHLEQEAYCSVLRAFLAQSDSISWDQLELITHLRRELRVSDDEHKELYARVKDDEIIERIKDWRHGGGRQATTHSMPQPVHDPISNSSFIAHKKQKTYHSGTTFSLGTRSLDLHSQSYSAKRGAQSGSRGRKHKQDRPARGLSSIRSLQEHSAGHIVNGPFTNRSSCGMPMEVEPAEATVSSDPLVGRKVFTRWPGDNSFYEAVITTYDPLAGRHRLVYDINKANESYEWVDLKEISPEDIRWVGEDPGISRRGIPGGQGHGVKTFTSHGSGGSGGSGEGLGRGRRSVYVQSRKDYSLQNGVGSQVSDDIEIANTESLIKEVERVFGATNPDPLEIEKAKKMLQEHEEALVDAITRLADASDGESDGEQTVSRGQSSDKGRGCGRLQNGGNYDGTDVEAEMTEGQGHDQRPPDNQLILADQQDEYIDDI